MPHIQSKIWRCILCSLAFALPLALFDSLALAQDSVNAEDATVSTNELTAATAEVTVTSNPPAILNLGSEICAESTAETIVPTKDPINWVVFTPTSRINPKGSKRLSLREVGAVAYGISPTDWMELRFTTALPLMNFPVSVEMTLAKRWKYVSLGTSVRAIGGFVFPYFLPYAIGAASPLLTIGSDKTFVNFSSLTFYALVADYIQIWGTMPSIGLSHRFKRVRLNVEGVIPHFPGQGVLYEFFGLLNYEVRFFRPKLSFGVGGSYSVCSNCMDLQMFLPLGYPILNFNFYF